jgi:2-polyprenyl-6-hydroxyphenyl methylase/3-demethylubiquinone-9 3-methyltransferase
VPVDNEMYDRLADTWWDDSAWLHLLRSALNPARLGLLRDAVAAVGLDPHGARALDVGCGGGLMAEDVAGYGFAVTGVDPSAASLVTARAHAEQSGLAIDYREGRGEALPVDDGEFDLVYCCDVLEHVDDVDRTIAEIGRVLEPGGLFMYDTINRTLRSWLLVVKLSQDWKATAWAEPDLHDWRMFIKPRELDRSLRSAGLEPCDRVGIASSNPVRALRAMRARARGRIDMVAMSAAIALRESRDQSTSYAGYAIKGSTSSG